MRDGRATAPPLEDLWRGCAPEVLATLVRRFGDFDSAEDALQEALLAAAQQWPQSGVPDNPAAWLVTVGSRRLLDQWRSDQSRSRREQQVLQGTVPVAAPAPDGGTSEVDDSLALLLLCCHPAVPRASQVALTLRAVGGLSTAQIARAFLVPEATMAQRISRAKSRIRQAGARFTLPTAVELPARVETVAQVLYLVFTEGHVSSAGETVHDVSLADEAIRLTRLLHRHLPDVGEVSGLLALMLLTNARREARVDAEGALVPLADQDRNRWDRRSIAEGTALLERTLPRGHVGPYQLQAAIAAVHAEALSAAATDWAQIELLYGMLHAQAPGPVVTLNHAVALAMVDGPAAGLRKLAALLDDPAMRANHRLHAVHAHLLDQAGHVDQARVAYATAARLTTSIPEQHYLNARAQRTR